MTCYLGKGVLWQNIVIIICLVTNNLVATKNKQKAFLTLENNEFGQRIWQDT